jgi:hypothetical protein
MPIDVWRLVQRLKQRDAWKSKGDSMTENESSYHMTWVSSRNNPTAESMAKADAFDAAVATAMREAMIDPLMGKISDELLSLHDDLDDMTGWPNAFASFLSALILHLMDQPVRAGKPVEEAAAEAQGRCRFVAQEVDSRIDRAITAPASAKRLSNIASDLKIDWHKPDVIDDAIARMHPKTRKNVSQCARDILVLEARNPRDWPYNFASGASTMALCAMRSYLDQGMEVDDAHFWALTAARALRAEIDKAQEAAAKLVTLSCESSFSEDAMGETIGRIEDLLARGTDADRDELRLIFHAAYAQLWPTLPRRPQDISGHAIAMGRRLSRKSSGYCRAVVSLFANLIQMRFEHDGYGKTKARVAAVKWGNLVSGRLRRQKLGRL